MSVPAHKLPLREKLCYGFGDFASVLYWQTFMVYLTFFYTDVFGLAAAAAGATIGLSRIFDAFLDPVMGMIADRTQTRWGKFRPYLLWLCVPFATFGVLTFTVPNFTASGKFWWAVVTYNGLMLLYTAINIPYTAMMGVLSPNPDERTTLSSVKFVGAYGAGMAISALLLPMAKHFGGGSGSAPRGWQLSFVVIGTVAIASFLITFFNTRERVEPPKSQKTSVTRDLRDLLTNGPWLVLIATTLTFVLFVAARGSVTVHYFKYFVGSHQLDLPHWIPWLGGVQEWHYEGLVSVFNTTGQLASLLGVMLVPLYAKVVGRKAAYISLLVVAVAATGSYYFLRADQLGLIIGLNILGSLTGGPLIALLWPMYADTADFSEWKCGRRATGLVFSASIFSAKQGSAIGAWVALAAMSSVGFKANAVQTPESLHGLVLLMSLVPAALGTLSILVVLLYPLNEAKVSQVGTDLAVRRAAELDGSTAQFAQS